MLEIILWIVAILVLLGIFSRLSRIILKKYFQKEAYLTVGDRGIAFVGRALDSRVRKWLQPPRAVIDWVAIHEGMQVLEVGAGSGTYTTEAARRLGDGKGTVHAIDIHPGMIKLLEKKLQKEQITNVTVTVASACDLPFLDKSFDRVFMITVLAEILNRQKALLEISHVLKDDGLLAVGEFLPDADYPLRRTVIRWCKEAGFELVDKYGRIMHYVLTFQKTTSDH
ncbi:MAG: class I SAM-dependent methyltransferase [Candidatus Heimdallarchaeota archaeon]